MGNAHVTQGRHNDARDAFDTAIELFEKLELPNEVDRTRLSSPMTNVDE